MMRTVIVAGSLAGAVGITCAPGYKPKKVLTGLTCDLETDTAASCNTNCCEPDDKKCGGNTNNCAGQTYELGSKATKAQQDAWNDRATTPKTWQTDCCTAKAICSSRGYTCPAGYTYDSKKASAVCPSDAASCIQTATTCCTKDPTTCGGVTAPTAAHCTAQKLEEVTTKGDAWNSLKITIANPANPATVPEIAKSCCGIKPTCAAAGYQCPAGKKKRANVASTPCTGFDLASCETPCCEADPNTCGGVSPAPTCSGQNQFYDTNLAGKATTAARKNTDCCTAKAMCSDYTCPAGKKQQVTAAKTPCTGGLDTCKEATCCDVDALTCGGQTGITCAVGFYNEKAATKAWAKYTQAEKDTWSSTATTAKTFNTDCCTAKLKCDAKTAGITTTPAGTVTPAATSTPAAPARLFGEHKVAVDTQKKTKNNMIYLGVGAVAGMAILSFVQRMRGVRGSYTQVDNELQ